MSKLCGICSRESEWETAGHIAWTVLGACRRCLTSSVAGEDVGTLMEGETYPRRSAIGEDLARRCRDRRPATVEGDSLAREAAAR